MALHHVACRRKFLASTWVADGNRRFRFAFDMDALNELELKVNQHSHECFGLGCSSLGFSYILDEGET